MSPKTQLEMFIFVQFMIRHPDCNLISETLGMLVCIIKFVSRIHQAAGPGRQKKDYTMAHKSLRTEWRRWPLVVDLQ
jgi:hypothetical protein